MKTNNAIIILTLSIIALINNSSAYAMLESSQDVNDMLHRPIEFSSDGITIFLKDTYNHPSYSQDFLPNNFSHLLQFLDHGKKSDQPRSFVKSVMRLFSNKVKGSYYINAYAFSEMLEQLPSLVEDHFTPERNGCTALQQSINDMLYTSFLEKFSFFKKSPEEFLDELSHNIVKTLHQDTTDISSAELQAMVIKLLELCLTKLVWCPEDHIYTWQSVKTIANQLSTLMDKNIITDSEDLNDLFITLIERYCFFLDISGTDMPIEYYEQIKSDIASHSYPLLELEEQEPLMEKKSDRLMRAVLESETRVRAHAYGITVR